MKKTLFSIVLLSAFASCSISKTYIDLDDGDPFKVVPPSEDQLIYQNFLIGDAGAPSLDVKEPTLKLFEQFLTNAGEQSAAIFLGDNIYLNGLPDSTHPRYDFYEQRILEQLKTTDHYEGRVFFIPGNHDWDDGGPDGLQAIKRQERFIENYLDRGNTFLPDNGFPGPVSVKLMDDEEHPGLREDIRLIVLDTQWWLQKHEKPYGDTGEYNLFDAGDVLIELDDILKKQRKDHLIIAGHHAFISHDNHGGYLPPSTHLKPPIFGSLYAMYRRVFGLEQDLNHHKYAEMVNEFQALFRTYEIEDLIYAAGHSHSLQYHKEEGKRINHHYLVSGSGSKESYVAQGRGAQFTHAGQGFLIVKYYGDGSIWMEAWAPVADGSTGELLYRTRLKEPYRDAFSNEEEGETVPDIDYTDSTKVVAPNTNYDGKSKITEWLIGDHNRKYWSVESEYPLFDITEIEGGLNPVRVGGKGQSTTLHLEREDGRDFVLRSIDKEAGRIWDEELRNTFALDLAQDQFSSLNPYGAVIIPTLADAIGTYHTNPKIYYVPNDPKLGVYADDISNQLALFEERPNGNMEDIESVGFSEEVISSTELFQELDSDIDHRVDQQEFAKNRLLDMLLADWDRHSDQWRWASFEPDDEQGKIYQPIPRDRDLALVKMTGLIPTLAKYLGPFIQYQNFDESYGNLKGLNANSLALTRRFTNQLTKSEWIDVARQMQNALTDAILEEAIRNYPNPVFERYGSETIETLKIRRDKIIETANDYYHLISTIVSVPGSNKRELFEIEILNETDIRVQVSKVSGNGELRERYYDRTFNSAETQEIRLFGMGGSDQFKLKGAASNPTKIRVVGGSGDDEIIDQTTKARLLKTVMIYETEKGNTISAGNNARVKRSDHPQNFQYNYQDDFRWNNTQAKLYFEYNTHDGLFIGGGPNVVRHGFRKHPASTHFARVNYAPKTGAANFKYNGRWNQVFDNWDATLEAEYLLPQSFKNFFGFGNETTLEQRSGNYYRARLYQYTLEPGLALEKNILTMYTGLRLRGTNVDKDPDNIVSDPLLGIPTGEFEEQVFTGIITKLHLKDVDDSINPKQGYRLLLDAAFNAGISNTSNRYTQVASELHLFYSVNLQPQITFANRTGTAHNIGDFPFYEANTLGGMKNVRGFKSRRFSGRTSFYNNTEARIELFDFYNYLIGGKVGLAGFVDTGRVWVNGGQSEVWHTSYGGGVWFNIFESFLINSSIGFSKEGSLVTIKAGFLF